MPSYILCDTAIRNYLLPFTFTRPVADCRVGIMTIREKWERMLGVPTSTLTEEYLSAKYPLAAGDDNICINGGLLPDTELTEQVRHLSPGEKLVQGTTLLAARLGQVTSLQSLGSLRPVAYGRAVQIVQYPWDIFQLNDGALRRDFELLVNGRTSRPLPESSRVINAGAVFVEEGATILCCTLNASTGPIYIGKGAQIMEGSLIRGPFSLGEGAVVKMGARIYGATTIGPSCVVGGEIKNSVFFGYSNKAHDGYVGDAVIGEWCNLGANTNCSNLKNNTSPVQIWSVQERAYRVAGNKCGMLMGDYSRTGINTMINTGSLLGVSCNIFGGNFPPKYLPGFTWGGVEEKKEYRLSKALDDADAWMSLKGRRLSDNDRGILEYIFNHTAAYRKHLSIL